MSSTTVVAEASASDVDAAPIGEDAKARLRALGITHLTPVQERTLRAVIVHRLDVLVQAPTGSGKTLAYLLPLAHALRTADAARGPAVDRAPPPAPPRPGAAPPALPSALVFLPTRELAAQVHEHARLHVQAAGFPCVLCVGGVAERAQLDAFAHPHPRRRPRVVVGTPGRIKDFRDRGVFSTDRVVFQVLDEADRLLDGGFECDVEEVAVPPGGACATVCLSATMPPKLERFLRRRLPPDHAHVVIGGPMGGNVGGSVEHVTCACRPEETVAAVMDAVDAYAARRGGGEEAAEDAEKAENNGDTKETRDENEKKPLPGSSGRAIVFAETKVAAERLSAQLAVAYESRRSTDAHPPRVVMSLHGDLPQPARDFALAAFRSGRCSVLVATDVAARGLDVAGVELVVHADLPRDPDAYAHRAGRAGRPGCETAGVSVLLVPPGDADAKAAVAAIERSLRRALRRVAAPGEKLRGDAADGRDAARAAEAREAARRRRAAEGSEGVPPEGGGGFGGGGPEGAEGSGGVRVEGGAAGEASAEDDARARARAGESFVVSDRLSDLAGDVAALGMDARGRKPSGKARRGRR